MTLSRRLLFSSAATVAAYLVSAHMIVAEIDPLPAAMGCLQDAAAGEFLVRTSVDGCFGGSSADLLVSWQEGASSAVGSSHGPCDSFAVDDTVGGAAREEMIESILGAAERAEVSNGWSSTTGYKAQIQWSCTDGGHTRRGELVFESQDVPYAGWASYRGVGENAVDFVVRPYNRAHGVGDAVLSVFKAHGVRSRRDVPAGCTGPTAAD